MTAATAPNSRYRCTTTNPPTYLPATLTVMPQVHISTNHRAERDAEYQALSKTLGMKSFPEPSFYSSAGKADEAGAGLGLHHFTSAATASTVRVPELSITKHEPVARQEAAEQSEERPAALQIIPKQKLNTDATSFGSCRLEARSSPVDIHDQINILKNMDFMKLNQMPQMVGEEEADGSYEEEEEESRSPPCKVT